MRKLLIISIAAIVLELVAMETDLMHLPSRTSIHFGVLAIALLMVALFDKPRPDERDQHITYRSSHIAFLTVSAVLLGTLLYQTLAQAVEPFTLVTILALVVGKIAGRLYSQRQR